MPIQILKHEIFYREEAFGLVEIEWKQVLFIAEDERKTHAT